jgi:hypothetical protein
VQDSQQQHTGEGNCRGVEVDSADAPHALLCWPWSGPRTHRAAAERVPGRVGHQRGGREGTGKIADECNNPIGQCPRQIALNVTCCGDLAASGSDGAPSIDTPGQPAPVATSRPMICTAMTFTMVIDGKIIA